MANFTWWGLSSDNYFLSSYLPPQLEHTAPSASLPPPSSVRHLFILGACLRKGHDSEETPLTWFPKKHGDSASTTFQKQFDLSPPNNPGIPQTFVCQSSAPSTKASSLSPSLSLSTLSPQSCCHQLKSDWGNGGGRWNFSCCQTSLNENCPLKIINFFPYPPPHPQLENSYSASAHICCSKHNLIQKLPWNAHKIIPERDEIWLDPDEIW